VWVPVRRKDGRLGDYCQIADVGHTLTKDVKYISYMDTRSTTQILAPQYIYVLAPPPPKKSRIDTLKELWGVLRDGMPEG